MRSIELTDDAYEVMEHLRRPDESFSDAILRLTGLPWLESLVGSMDEETAKHYDQVIEQRRRML